MLPRPMLYMLSWGWVIKDKCADQFVNFAVHNNMLVKKKNSFLVCVNRLLLILDLPVVFSYRLKSKLSFESGASE